MGDLEDAFLKKNVPGRYTSWSEENDDERRGDDDNDNEDDSEDDEYYLEGLPPLPGSTPSAANNCRIMEPATSASISNGLQKSCNTGVKGVLADYREAQRREKEEARLKQQEGVVPRPKQSHYRHRHDNDQNNNDDSSNSEDDHTDDDEASNGEYSKYLAKLQPGTTIVPHPFFRKSQYPKVTPEEYVQLLDEMEKNVHKDVLYMIVHLFDESIRECQQLHSVLKLMRLGSVQSSSRFIKVDALEANPDMDTIILPTILIYDKRGELKHNLVRVTDDLPRGFKAHDLCEYFDKLGIVV